MKPLVLVALLAAVPLSAVSGLAPAQARQTFTGTITDSECAQGDHSIMRMGSSATECALACVDAHGATLILFDGKTSYALSDQQRAEDFAGRKVRIVGTLDAAGKTITVESISAQS